MARDYKNTRRNAPTGRSASKRPAATSRGGGSGSGVGTFFAGLVLGAIGGAAALQFYHMRAEAPTEVAAPAPPPEPAPDASQRPRFEFYKLLPEMEVVVPEAEERAVMAEPKPSRPAQNTDKPAAPVAPGERYLLQVGAFKQHQDADRLKAQLALLGVEAQILRVERDGEVWHRVRVGPYDRDELRTVRERLAGEGIDSVLLKLAG